MESRDRWLHGGKSVGEGVSVKDTRDQSQGDGMVEWWIVYGGLIPGPWCVRLSVCSLKSNRNATNRKPDSPLCHRACVLCALKVEKKNYAK